jgi:Kef-type K+ transport system membrane component KefB
MYVARSPVEYTGSGGKEKMDLVLTLSVSLCAALVPGYGTQRIGLSPIVGSLLAGGMDRDSFIRPLIKAS